MDKAPRPKVYISGPLTSSGTLEDNINAAVEWQKKLIAAGFAPLNPMLTGYVDPDEEIPHEIWMEVDLPWVEVADAVLRLPGYSVGAEKECNYAYDIGVPVYEVEEGEFDLMVQDLLGGDLG